METNLAAVDAAIAKALNAQSYSTGSGGGSLTRANLKELREERDYWVNMIEQHDAQNTNTGGIGDRFNKVEFGNPV